MQRYFAVLALVLLASPAAAQDSWPSKPVTVIVPFGAGGNTDALARIYSARLSARLGQQLVIENRIANSPPAAFKASDLPLIVAYSYAVVLERRSAAELAAGDYKALGRWIGAIKAMNSLATKLRLSPLSRGPNTPTRPGSKVERPLSYYERQALLQEGENGSA